MKINYFPFLKKFESFYQIDFSTFTLPIITVYRNLPNYDNKIVAIIFDHKNGKSIATNIVMVKDSLEEIFKNIPMRFIAVKKHEQDDDTIIMSFI